MERTAENKNYSTDTRKFSTALLADKIHDKFTDSPVTDLMVMKDLCYRGPGFIGQHGKETKTSWDTLSYTLIQGHNVFTHIHAVQEANRRYEQGVIPKMLLNETFNRVNFGELVDKIFSLNNRQQSLDMIDSNSRYWMQIKSGQGFSGKKAINASTMFSQLFDVEESTDEVLDEVEDSDLAMEQALGE